MAIFKIFEFILVIEVICFDFPDEKQEKLICYSFCPDGKNLSIWTKTQFIPVDTTNGKVLNFKDEENSVKTIINMAGNYQ